MILIFLLKLPLQKSCHQRSFAEWLLKLQASKERNQIKQFFRVLWSFLWEVSRYAVSDNLKQMRKIKALLSYCFFGI